MENSDYEPDMQTKSTNDKGGDKKQRVNKGKVSETKQQNKREQKEARKKIKMKKQQGVTAQQPSNEKEGSE